MTFVQMHKSINKKKTHTYTQMILFVWCLVWILLLDCVCCTCVDHSFAQMPIIRVIDGDTLVILLPNPLPEPLGNELHLRIIGIDTAEITLAKCDYEKQLGTAARSFTQGIVMEPNSVQSIRLCKWDKFGGRVLGDVVLHNNGELLSDALVKNGFAARYNGRGMRTVWCDQQTKEEPVCD